MTAFYKQKIQGVNVISKTKKEASKIRGAIFFLKRRRPQVFKLVKTLNAILVYSKRGYENQLFYKERIWICKTQTVLESSIAYLTSLLVHEAEHLRQYDKGEKPFGSKAEEGAYRRQRKFLKSTGTEEEVSWLDSLYKEKWWIRKKNNGKTELFNRSNRVFGKFIELYLSKKLQTRLLRKD